MRLAFFLILSLISGVTHAGCSEIARTRTDTLLIIIGSGGCATEEDMIVFATKKPTDREFSNFGKEVPFFSECALIKGGFKCQADGKTPLAGATYKRIKFGRSGNSCAPEGELGEKYICIKGCSKPTVPEYLDGFDGSC